jgi:hypothetical protein
MIQLEGLQAHALAQAAPQVVEAMTPAAQKARNLILATVVAGILSVSPTPSVAADYNQNQSGSAVKDVLIKGAGAAVGVGLGSLIGGGNGRVAAMVVGGVLGSEVASRTFGGPSATERGSQPGSFGGFGASPNGFKNGTVPLAANERASMERARHTAVESLNVFREARVAVEHAQYQYDFATGSDKRELSRLLMEANGTASKARRVFEDNRRDYTLLVHDAAAKYNRNVAEFADDAHALAAVPTEPSVSVQSLDNAIERVSGLRARPTVSFR